MDTGDGAAGFDTELKGPLIGPYLLGGLVRPHLVCEPAVNLVPASFSFWCPGSLSAISGPARLMAFRMTGMKAAQADATNIDKGLTLSLLQKGIGL